MKKRIVVSVLALVLMLGLSGCGELSKVNKAIENNDPATVAEYYSLLKDEDKAEVAEKVRLYCQGLSVSYTDEQIDYETVKASYDILASEVMNGDESFAGMVESVELLHTSREAYKIAEEAFAAQDYEKALAEYEKVLSSDKNIEKVRENIDICKKNLLPDVVGTWENHIDVGKAMSQMMGLGLDDKFKFEMITYYEFREDGTGVKYTDQEAVKENFERFIEACIDMIVNQYQTQYGISKEQLNKEFKAQYGMDMNEYIKANSKLDSVLESMEIADQEFVYEVNDENILVTFEDLRTCDFEREGDELLLDTDVSTGSSKLMSQFGIELPMRFTKSE